MRDSDAVASTTLTSTGETLTFGRFRLMPARQQLLRDGTHVPLGSRALDILTVLVRRSGEAITKHDLIAAVWPDTFVDESNLKVNVCHLRRALGDTQKQPKYIATVPGRGYRFVAPVQTGIADLSLERNIVHREREIADLLAALRGKPHVSVVGQADGMVPWLVRPLT
jgi:DNA-binding winged helix-turn-helix (wHTH) protein